MTDQPTPRPPLDLVVADVTHNDPGRTASATARPLTPDEVNAIVRDLEDPRYPCRITVYCDPCGVEDTGEYMVSAEMTSMQRLGVARRHLTESKGWRHDPSTGEDFCPFHAGSPG